MKYHKIGIIVAMQSELEGLLSAMEFPCEEVISGMHFYSGTIEGKPVILTKSGVGKVFAAMCAQTLILRYAPDVLLGAGVAGSLQGLTVGGAVIADKLVQHDMDTSAVGDPVGMISGIDRIYLPADPEVVRRLVRAAESLDVPYQTGTIASGDQFIADSAKKAYIAGTFGAAACEMEGAAIAQTAYVNGLPFAVIRGISDSGDDNSGTDYRLNLKMAADTSTAMVKEFIRSM